MNIKLFYISLFAIFCGYQLAATASEIDIIQDEDYIPFYAHLEHEIDTEVGRLELGQRVVVIRPVDSSHVRVDVSRKGTATIPVSATDLASEMEKIKSKAVPNVELVPRMSFFLGNRIVSGESNWKVTLRGDRVKQYKRWILLYGDALNESIDNIISIASEHYNDLPDVERDQTLFVYMDIVGNKKSIQDLASRIQPSIQCMPGYLSQAYSRSFDHIDFDRELPQIVEVASSGRLLDSANGTDGVKAWLQDKL